jgi:hypothetical protein
MQPTAACGCLRERGIGEEFRGPGSRARVDGSASAVGLDFLVLPLTAPARGNAMRHGSGIVEGRLVLRAACGVMATAGLVVGLGGAIKYGLAQDWLEVLFRLGLLSSAWLFGHFAFTGRLPHRRSRDGHPVRTTDKDRR